MLNGVGRFKLPELLKGTKFLHSILLGMRSGQKKEISQAFLGEVTRLLDDSAMVLRFEAPKKLPWWA